jgi:hypothetical protein
MIRRVFEQSVSARQGEAGTLRFTKLHQDLPGGDMQTEEMRLDGNAAGGVLREVFARDVTAALATCTGCGAIGAVGALLEYGHGMGMILRCPGCDTAMLRIVRRTGWLHVDASGISLLMIPESTSIS